MRLNAFDKRFFVINEMNIMWWENEDKAVADLGKASGKDAVGVFAKSAKNLKGYIDLLVTAVVPEINMGNDTTFTLKPRDGEWPAGALGKGGKSKTFVLDAESSRYTRSEWIHTIKAHLWKA